MDKSKLRVLISAEQIQERVQELGRQITAAYPADRPIFLIGILKGAVPFLADLARSIDRNVRLDRDGLIAKSIAADPKAGLITVTSPVDGIERRLAYQRLAEYPIYVSAGLETSAIRARWSPGNGCRQSARGSSTTSRSRPR